MIKFRTMLQIFMTPTKMTSKPTREDADNKASSFLANLKGESS